MIYTEAYGCFKICSDWKKFYEKINFFNLVFLKNVYLVHHLLANVLKWLLSFKVVLNFWKLQIVFKIQIKLANVSQLKDCLPFDLVFGAVYRYMRGRCCSFYYG